MTKKIISVFLVVSVLFALFATSFSASALVDTTITYGDFDGKNGVTTSDAVEVLKVSAMLGTVNNEAAFKRCDINSDGVITIYDARQILRACAGIATIQPQGEFSGFDGGGVFVDPAIAVEYFNIAVNKIKTEKPGFIRNEAVDIKGFKIGSVSLSGFTANESAQSVSDMIESMLVSESAPAPTLESFKDENCDNAMSVETETYVSNLKSSGVLGIKCVKKPTEGTITIKIALPDCEVENISHTAVGDVLNARLVQEKSQNALVSVFGKVDGEDAIRNRVENCILTAVFDTKTGKVVSYTTKYETELYIPSSTIGVTGGNLTAQLKGVQYTTAYTVTYTDFEW
jgi:hypothetical protein